MVTVLTELNVSNISIKLRENPQGKWTAVKNFISIKVIAFCLICIKQAYRIWHRHIYYTHYE
jgi:hypothetical protein